MAKARKAALPRGQVFGMWSMPRSAWSALPVIALPTADDLARTADPVKEREAAALRRKRFEVPVSEQTLREVVH